MYASTETWSFATANLLSMESAGVTAAYALNFTQQNQAVLAFALWDDVAAFSASLISDKSPGQTILQAVQGLTGDWTRISLGDITSPYVLGVNSSTYLVGEPYSSHELLLGSDIEGIDTFELGSIAFETLVHEIGHSIVVDHLADTDDEDIMLYTIMNTAVTNSGEWQPSTPMTWDIDTMIELYGASTTTRTGDDTYGFNATFLNSGFRSVFDFDVNLRPLVTVYDNGGNDTFDASGFFDDDGTACSVRLDLNTGVDHASRLLDGNQYTFAVMYTTTTIENGVTGNGDDQLIGNSVGNYLWSNGGDDTVTPGGGDDHVYGGAGEDTAVFALDIINYVYEFVTGNGLKVTALVGNEGTDLLYEFEYVTFGSKTYDIVPDAPVVEAISAMTAKEDKLFSFTLPAGTVSDDDIGDVITLTATLANGNALPDWLHFDAASQTFSGTPTQADVGSLQIKLTASDSYELTDTSVFTLTVQAQPDAPVVNGSVADQVVAEDADFTLTLASDFFTDEDPGDAVSFSARLSGGNALPSWLKFNAVTRTFSGEPDNWDVGDYSIRITGTDKTGNTASTIFNLTVFNVNDGPFGTPTADLVDGAEDQSYLLYASELLKGFSDIDGGTLRVTELTIASGATVTRNSDGDYVVTPVADFNGALSIAYKVSDGLSAVSATQTLTIAPANDAPTATDVSVSVQENTPLTFDAAAASVDIDGDKLTLVSWQVLEGEASATIDSKGRLSVTYTGDDLAVGETENLTLTYRITDGEFLSTGTLTVTVNGESEPGDDIVDTDEGHRIDGTSAAERIFGNGGNDKIFAKGGNDTIEGGLGTDKISGGTGRDTFVFHPGDGRDVISDFSLRERDVIDLSDVESVKNFKDLKRQHLDDRGDDTYITLGNGDIIVLADIDMVTLGKQNFLI